MFSSPRNNVIESDEGFCVEMLGRTGIKYTEGLRTTYVSSEVLLGPHGMVVYTDSIKYWQVPSGNFDDDKKIDIIKNAHRVSMIGGEILRETPTDNKNVFMVSLNEGHFLFDGFEIEETINDSKKDEIIENIRKAFLFQGFEIEVE